MAGAAHTRRSAAGEDVGVGTSILTLPTTLFTIPNRFYRGGSTTFEASSPITHKLRRCAPPRVGGTRGGIESLRAFLLRTDFLISMGLSYIFGNGFGTSANPRGDILEWIRATRSRRKASSSALSLVLCESLKGNSPCPFVFRRTKFGCKRTAPHRVHDPRYPPSGHSNSPFGEIVWHDLDRHCDRSEKCQAHFQRDQDLLSKCHSGQAQCIHGDLLLGRRANVANVARRPDRRKIYS